MSYNKLNVIGGWAVFLISAIVYLLTIEPTTSFWDTGEFIASAYQLEVGHPPGAPFFMLLARLFILFFPAGSEAMAVNVLSATSAAFTVMFLHWTITHMAKKIALQKGELSIPSTIAIIGSGVVGSLMYAFSDTAWFSAVEGEVYALSSLFTAIVFWAILKWENEFQSRRGLRWLVFIAYMMGLSIGVHLLNLLAIPAIAFVIYFKKFEITPKGLVLTLLAALVALGVIQVGIIPGTVKLAAQFELFFVNNLGMAFNSGVLAYALVLAALIVVGLIITKKKGMVVANTVVLCTTVILLGYGTFALVVVRSAANPPMDENNPENVFTLLSYLNREQYGDRPLLYGQHWNSPVDETNPTSDGDIVYFKSFSVHRKLPNNTKLVQAFKNEYDAVDLIEASQKEGKNDLILVEEYLESDEKKGTKYNYQVGFETVFPRMYSSQPNHIEEYKSWSNYGNWSNPRDRAKVLKREEELKTSEDKQQQYEYYLNTQGDQMSSQQRANLTEELAAIGRSIAANQKRLTPTFGENMNFFKNYQIGWMYMRYFLWNFSGRQNDIQGHGSLLDGNWLTGINAIDKERLGNQQELPIKMANNKGLNKLYLLPLILGLIGLVFQFIRNKKDFVIVTLLFLLTGLAIVVYLNQYPMQPRERDYAYVGSFYAFAIWVGLGVFGIYNLGLREKMSEILKIGAITMGTAVVIMLLEGLIGSGHAFSFTMAYMILIGFGAILLVKLLALKGKSKMPLALVACGLGAVVPIVTIAAEWDDHNRAKRTTAADFAKNYLDSLDPNAIIFTNGDNDTFPLWYAQEVEGYRRDVKVVNLSLLNTDWYIDQVKRKAYEADGVPISLQEWQYRQGTRDALYLDAAQDDKFMPLDEAIRFALDDNKKFRGSPYNYLPTNNLKLPADSADLVQRGIVEPKDAGRIQDVDWTLRRQVIYKNTFLVLDLLRTNNWERPVYFAVTIGEDAFMDLGDYFQLEGLAYKLVPFKRDPNSPPPTLNTRGTIASDKMYENIMGKPGDENGFQWGGMDSEGEIYMDENNRRMTVNLRLQMSALADQLIREGKQDKAVDILKLAVNKMPNHNVPFDRFVIPVADGLFEVGEKEEGLKIARILLENAKSEVEYYLSLDPEFASQVEGELLTFATDKMRMLQQSADRFGLEEFGAEIDSTLTDYLPEIDAKRLRIRQGTYGEF